MQMPNPSRPRIVKDHFLSQDSFEICWDNNNEIGQTQGVVLQQLSNYYESQQYASHQKSKNGLFGVAYRLAQKYTFRYKWRVIKPFLRPSSKVLDYGCGLGEFINFLQPKGIHVQGYEPNKSVANQAQENKIPVSHTQECLNGPYTYNLISLWHALEHIPDADAALQRFHKLLSDNGILVLALPNPNALDAQWYGPTWAAWDVPRHLWHFTPKGIVKKVEAQGFTLTCTHPLILDAFYVAILSERYQKKRFPWLQGLWRGYLSNRAARQSGNYSSMVYIFSKR